MKKFFIIFFVFILGFSHLSKVQDGEDRAPNPPILKFAYENEPKVFEPLKEGILTLRISVPQNYHIFGGKELKVDVESENIGVEDIIYPKPVIEDNSPLYRGDVIVKIKVKVLKKVNLVEGNFKINWQGCQDFGDKVCFLPSISKFPFKIEVKGNKEIKEVKKEKNEVLVEKEGISGDVGELINKFEEKGRFVGFKSPKDLKKWYQDIKGGKKEEKNIFEKVAKENILLAVIMAVIFGFLSSLTPCVYPVIPITIAYIGSKSQGKGKMSGFVLSLFFVLGLALVYASLGVISSLLGISFGSLTQKPIFGIPVAIIFAILGLSLFGLFEISMPSQFSTKIEEGKRKGKGYLGAFLIGALSGLVVSPCIGPLLLAILVIVASIGSAFLGFLYLFAFAIGMGILFIIIGTFSGIIASLPKSGTWMDSVKIVFGALVFAASFYFGGLYLKPIFFMLFSGVLIGFTAGFLIYGSSKHFLSKTHIFMGVLLTIIAFIVIIPFTPQLKHSEHNMEFENDLKSAIRKAERHKKPLLLDFRADWCAACLELEKKTWVSKEALEVFSEVVPVKIDFTKETEETKNMTKVLNISGLPTVILFEARNVKEGEDIIN